MNAGGEEFVVILVTAVVKGQYSNGFIRGQTSNSRRIIIFCCDLAWTCFICRVRCKLIPGKIAQRQHQDGNDGEIQFLPRVRGDGLATVDVFFFLDAFGSKFKTPRRKTAQTGSRS